jgi:hypothetical protein
VVVVVGLTDNPFPVPTNVPPHEPEYQVITSPAAPPPPLSVRVVLPPLQIVSDEAVADVDQQILIHGYRYGSAKGIIATRSASSCLP